MRISAEVRDKHRIVYWTMTVHCSCGWESPYTYSNRALRRYETRHLKDLQRTVDREAGLGEWT